MKNEMHFQQIFPQGEKLPEQFSRYFNGQAYLAPLTRNGVLNVPVSNVTFEPGCRNNWHSHTGGQLLLCTAGCGYYQEQGQPARELLPGDVVEIAPDVVHWHGAAPDSWFSHLAVECNPGSNRNTWLGPVDDDQYRAATTPRASAARLSEEARLNHEAWFAGDAPAFSRTDPELAEVFANFAFGEVPQYGDLDRRTRILVTMAATIAQNTVGEYRNLLRAAWVNGITPDEIKELLYHAVPYVGVARVAECLAAANDFLTARGVALPLGSHSVATPGTRYEEGLALQKSIFGEGIDRMAESMPDDQKYIARLLSANCFGDYQTRPVFGPAMRELLTFSMLVSLGGCESQVKGHIQGNLRVGNERKTLLAVVTQLLPYNGYPRTLNALACLNEAAPENTAQ